MKNILQVLAGMMSKAKEVKDFHDGYFTIDVDKYVVMIDINVFDKTMRLDYRLRGDSKKYSYMQPQEVDSKMLSYLIKELKTMTGDAKVKKEFDTFVENLTQGKGD